MVLDFKNRNQMQLNIEKKLSTELFNTVLSSPSVLLFSSLFIFMQRCETRTFLLYNVDDGVDDDDDA